MKKKLLIRLIFIMLAFFVNNASLAELNIENLSFSNTNNCYDQVISDGFEVWKVIDIVKAIKSTPENRKYFCNEIFDQIVGWYSNILKMIGQDKFINKNELDFIFNLFNDIKANFFEVFFDVDTKEFFCIILILEKIEHAFNEELRKKNI